jgi:hypothetical protein
MEPLTGGLLLASLGGGIAGGIMQNRGAMQQMLAEERKQKKQREDLMALYNDADYLGIKDSYAPLSALLPGAIEGMQGNFDVDMGEFNYGKTAQDFLDPSIAYQQDQMGRQIEQSAATRGNLLSGAAQKALQKNASDLAMRDYGNAYTRMESDKQFGYNDYINQFKAKTDNTNRKMEQLRQLFGAGTQGLNAQNQFIQNTIDRKANAITGTVPQVNPQGFSSLQAGQTISNFTSPQNMAALLELFGK